MDGNPFYKTKDKKMKQSFNLDIACNFNVGRSTDNQSIDGNGGSCSFQLIELIELFFGLRLVWFDCGTASIQNA